MIEASEALHYLQAVFTERTLTIAVSQSGESAEMVRLLSGGLLRGPSIGVTNSPGSTLATQSTFTLLTHAGPESTVSCKTYLAGLQALHWLGSGLLDPDLVPAQDQIESLSGLVEDYLASWPAHVDAIREELSGIEQIFVTGRGASLSTAGTGGLILKESTRFSCEGMSSAAFRHGPLEMLSSRVLACICLGDSRTAALNLRLFEEARRGHAKAFLIGPSSVHSAFRIPTVEASLLPVLEILPIQMLSLALAARLGIEAGRFTLAAKITATE
jgi:glucosamine--fructose-6-phosphate aminotransferase (isomerizing)